MLSCNLQANHKTPPHFLSLEELFRAQRVSAVLCIHKHTSSCWCSDQPQSSAASRQISCLGPCSCRDHPELSELLCIEMLTRQLHSQGRSAQHQVLTCLAPWCENLSFAAQWQGEAAPCLLEGRSVSWGPPACLCTASNRAILRSRKVRKDPAIIVTGLLPGRDLTGSLVLDTLASPGEVRQQNLHFCRKLPNANMPSLSSQTSTDGVLAGDGNAHKLQLHAAKSCLLSDTS